MFCLFICIFSTGITWAFFKVQNFEHLVFKDNTNYIYDRYGDLIGYTSPKIAIFEKTDSFNPKLIQSILLIEDRSFWTNYGISIFGTLRSIIYYIPYKLVGRRPRGGSTITQQIVRQFYLQSNISLTRKVKEFFLAFVTSIKYPKKLILEAYMNRAYFSNNIYGFTAAANVFWNKNTNELDVNEIAILVSMLKGTGFSPINNTYKLNARKNMILEIMFKHKLIFEEEFTQAFNAPVKILLDRFYHVNHVSLKVKNLIIKKFGEDSYNTGGFNIYTTLDKKIQDIALSSLQESCFELENTSEWNGPVEFNAKDIENLYKFNDQCGKFFIPAVITNKNGSFKGINSVGILNSQNIKKYNKKKDIEIGDVIILEKKTMNLTNLPSFNGYVIVLKNGYLAGDVIALVGGIDLLLLRDDLTSVIREVGSCIKIINLLILFNLKPELNTDICTPDKQAVVENNLLKYVNDKEFYRIYENYYTNNIKNIWPVRNWDNTYFRDISLRIAFEHSRNIPFLYVILNVLGYKKYHKALIDLNLINNDQIFLPSMILGGIHKSPMKFIETICGILNKNHPIKNRFISEICDDKENILKAYKSNKQEDRIISNGAIYKVLSCMHGCITRGTGKRLSGLMKNIYAKTGTASNNKGAFCVVVTKEYTMFICVCKNNGQPLGPNVFGARSPVECARKIILKLPELEDTPFITLKGFKKILKPYNPYNSEDNLIIEDDININDD